MPRYRIYTIGRDDHFWSDESIQCADGHPKGTTDHGWSRYRALGTRPFCRAAVFLAVPPVGPSHAWTGATEESRDEVESVHHSTLIAPLHLSGTLVGSLFKLGHRLELGGLRLFGISSILLRGVRPRFAQELQRRSSFFFKVPSFDCIVA